DPPIPPAGRAAVSPLRRAACRRLPLDRMPGGGPGDGRWRLAGPPARCRRCRHRSNVRELRLRVDDLRRDRARGRGVLEPVHRRRTVGRAQGRHRSRHRLRQGPLHPPDSTEPRRVGGTGRQPGRCRCSPQPRRGAERPGRPCRSSQRRRRRRRLRLRELPGRASPPRRSRSSLLADHPPGGPWRRPPRLPLQPARRPRCAGNGPADGDVPAEGHGEGAASHAAAALLPHRSPALRLVRRARGRRRSTGLQAVRGLAPRLIPRITTAQPVARHLRPPQRTSGAPSHLGGGAPLDRQGRPPAGGGQNLGWPRHHVPQAKPRL
ncbi:MAG: hypothetical protein AVDCRST_MAG76-2292, partial [uncultured Acidimicrobiales bacterium]